ncbi:MAG: TIGR03757 family integrating conjugative element protein [Saezia sp.]
MRLIRFIFGAVIGLMLTVAAHADNQGGNQEAGEIIVVTDSKHPVYNIPPNTKQILLDAPAQLLEILFSNLPDDLSQAQSIAANRLQQGGQDFQVKMQHAVQGVVDAWALQVEKIPAIVLNRQYVVYGEHDVRLALEQIKNHLKTQTEENNSLGGVVGGGSGAQDD